MRNIFLGPLRYWLIWPVLVVILFACGKYGLHVRSFVPFIFVVLAISVAAILFVVLSYRPDERVTRDPMED
jgi:hypothetical protein